MPHTLIRRHFFRSLFFLSSPSYLLFFALPCLCFSRRQNERVIAIYRSNTGEKRRNEGARQTIALRDNARRRCFADAFKIIGGFSNGEFFSPFSPFFFFFFGKKRRAEVKINPGTRIVAGLLTLLRWGTYTFSYTIREGAVYRTA